MINSTCSTSLLGVIFKRLQQLTAHPVISNVGKDGWGIMQRWQTVAGQKVMGLKFTAKEGMDPNFG